jgi:hypothetical protein
VSPLATKEADADTYCAEGHAFKQHVDQVSIASQGWGWTDSSKVPDACAAARAEKQSVNCDKWGYSNRGYGKTLEFVVDTQHVRGASRNMPKRRLVVFFDRATARNFRVGNSELAPAAWVECVSGCACTPFELGGEDGFYPSENAYGSIGVSYVMTCYVG